LNKEREKLVVNEDNIKQAIRVFIITTYQKEIVVEKDPGHINGYDYAVEPKKKAEFNRINEMTYYKTNFESLYLKKTKKYFE
jgi:hypothetical protein